MSADQMRSRSFDKDMDDHCNREIYTEIPHRKSTKKTGTRDENQRIRSKRKSHKHVEVQNRDDVFDSNILLLSDDSREKLNIREISDEEHHLQEYVYSKRGIEPEDVRKVKENGEIRRTKDARDSRRAKDRTTTKRDKEKRKTYPNEDLKATGSRRTRAPRRTRKPSPVRSSSSTSWTLYDEKNDSIAYIVYERPVSIGKRFLRFQGSTVVSSW